MNMPLSRREFIGLLSATIFAVRQGSLFAGSPEFYGLPANGILSPLDTRKFPYDMAPMNDKDYVVIADIDHNQVQFFPGISDCHSVLVHPKNQESIILIPKYSNLAAELSLRTGKIERTINAAKSCQFYGHGIFSPDGKYLYSSESRVDSGEGFIVMRDSKTWGVLAEFPSFGRSPHECKWVKQGEILAVGNAGPLEYMSARDGKECVNVSYINIKTWKLVNQFFTSADQRNGHLYISSRGNLLVGTCPGVDRKKNCGYVYISRDNGPLVPLPFLKNDEDLVKDEVLSLVASVDGRYVAATYPFSNKTLIWDLDTNKPAKSYDWIHPTGIAYCEASSAFIVSVENGKVRMFNFEKELDSSSINYTAGNTTHMTRIVNGVII